MNPQAARDSYISCHHPSGRPFAPSYLHWPMKKAVCCRVEPTAVQAGDQKAQSQIPDPSLIQTTCWEPQNQENVAQ